MPTPAKVYFTDVRCQKNSSLLQKLERLFVKAGFDSLVEPGDLVAIKVHFGEKGNTEFIRPQFARRVVDRVKRKKGRPFLTDANTLYVGSRANAADHLQTALENGFGYEVTGAPLVIADGLLGKDYVAAEINKRRFKEVRIASAIYHADALIAISHFKGHEATGFGGTLKNIGMGSGCRSGKQQMHSDVLPQVHEEKCEACGKCRNWCPAKAITVEKTARIDDNLCIGCGECTVTCPNGAIRIEWKTEPDIIQEKIAEYALGAVQNKEGKVGFINFVMGVTPDCDCCSWSDLPVVSDVGILASKDPVALDQASLDLVTAQTAVPGSRLGTSHRGENKFLAMHGVDGTVQLAHGEAIGLGSRDYTLIEVK